MFNKYIIESVVGLFSGVMMGFTGMPPNAIILLLFDLCKLRDYKTIIGTILFLNLFPLTIGSVYAFAKNDKIDYIMGGILLFTIVIGSFIGSHYLLDYQKLFTVKTIKAITTFISFVIFILFFYSYFNEKN
jgi:uncharacterized membrane protein YfcA